MLRLVKDSEQVKDLEAPERFPRIDEALLRELDREFPERTPDLKTTLDQIRFESGARHVVRFLHWIKSEQERLAGESPGVFQ